MGNSGLTSKYKSSSTNKTNAITNGFSNATTQGSSTQAQSGANASSNQPQLALSSSSSSPSQNAQNQLNSSSNNSASSSNAITRTSKVSIPYERWIKCDCKKWGHFKDFDFYNLTVQTSSLPNTTTTNNNNSNNIIIAINKQNNNQHHHQHHHHHHQNKLTNNSLTLTSLSSNSNTNNSNIGFEVNQNASSNSYFISANLNQYLSSSSTSSGANTILSSLLSSSESKNNNSNCVSTIASSNSSSIGNSLNTSSNIGPLYYVNGSFFRPIERLGDSQFIISQYPLSDVIVTVPCNIGRYKPNDKSAKDTAARLNRVIGVCEQFVVFQIWKGNNESEIFIYNTDHSNNNNNNNNNNNEFLNCNTCNSTNQYLNNNFTNNTTTNTSSIDTMIQSSSNRIVRKLNRRFNSRTYTCLISPDRTVLLITPDYEFNYSYSHHTHSHAECTVIINITNFQLLRIIPARFDQRFAFDPRYGLPNHRAPRFAEFDTVRGQIFDLSLEKVIVCSNHTLKTKVFRVEYTKDGYLIIVICTLPVFQRRARRNYFIYILNSSTLLHMRSIIDYRGPLLSTYMFSNDFNLLFNMYPSLSNCASSIAVLKNIEPSLNTRVIELYSLPNVCSMSLKELCRRVILRHVDNKHLNRLPLPPKLVSYLSFNNTYSNNHIINQNSMNNYNINSRHMINNLKKNISNKCNSLSTRINFSRKSLSNLFQIKNSTR